MQEGLIGRFGTLDPSDGARSERYSLSAHYAAKGEGWSLNVNAYGVRSTMTLWNDYTHVLDDPVNGDQEQQSEARTTGGGQAAYAVRLKVGPVVADTTLGVQGRYDDVYVDRRHTRDRAALGYCETEQDPAPDGAYVPAVARLAVDFACDADRVRLGDVALYLQSTVRWRPWLRTVLGLREDDQTAFDHSFISGFRGDAGQALFQPK